MIEIYLLEQLAAVAEHGTLLKAAEALYLSQPALSRSMKKVVEYTGEEVAVVTYWQVGEFLSDGDYRVSIFADGSMIGSRTFSFN